MPFSSYRDNFDSETLAVLEIAFNEAGRSYSTAVAISTQKPRETLSPS